jgi:hypothetical protein
VIVASRALALKEAIEKAKLPKGVRWAVGGIACVDGVCYGLLTCAPRRGESRPTVEVAISDAKDIPPRITEAVSRLG